MKIPGPSFLPLDVRDWSEPLAHKLKLLTHFRVLGQAVLVIGLSISALPALGAAFHPRGQSLDEEALGRQAEQAGRLREALTHYMTALQQTTEDSDSDERLREEIIAIVQKLKPSPTTPDDAMNYMKRGQSAATAARDQAGYERAVAEFQRALRIAPWLPSGYQNLGAMQEKAGQYGDAIRSLKLYLLAAPVAPDAQDVQERIAALESKQGQVTDEPTAAQKKREQERKAEGIEALRQKVRGRIYTSRIDCIVFVGGQPAEPFGCNQTEYRGHNWHDSVDDDRAEFIFPGDGTVHFSNSKDNRPARDEFIGIPDGPTVEDIKWHDPQSTKLVWVRISSDGSVVTRSWNRSASARLGIVGMADVLSGAAFVSPRKCE
jgi:tetratricopeptide (TPR) repeat protein